MIRAITLSVILFATCDLQPCVGATFCVKLRSIFAKGVPNVIVRIVDPKVNFTTSGSTNLSGEWCAADLRPGSYSVEVKPKFYLAATYWDVVIPPASERWLEIELYAREIRGFEVLSYAELTGQIETSRNGSKPTRICVEAMKKRNCEALSAWGEYRVQIPLGLISVWVESEGGVIMCKQELTIRTKERISIECSL